MNQSIEEFFEKEELNAYFYNIAVNIIEASNLAIENMVSRVSVQLGQEKRYTKVKDSSERPYYNEVFCFIYETT